MLEEIVEMSEVSVGRGHVLGFGGSNARTAISEAGELYSFDAVDTPTQPSEFFGWMARQVLEAANDGQSWLVAGFPGPVSPDGKLVGPMKNVDGLADEQYDLVDCLAGEDPAARRLLADERFTLIAVNDGNLAAHAAAARIGNFQYDRVASLILGSGVGAGLVDRDPDYPKVYRVDSRLPIEIGHIPLSDDPTDTFENAVSGTALAKIAVEAKLGPDSRSLREGHPAWRRTGEKISRMANTLGLILGARLVVPCGGIGSGAANEYRLPLEEIMTAYKTYGNATQKLYAPTIIPVPRKDRQVFEMYGGEGVMRDFYTRAT